MPSEKYHFPISSGVPVLLVISTKSGSPALALYCISVKMTCSAAAGIRPKVAQIPDRNSDLRAVVCLDFIVFVRRDREVAVTCQFGNDNTLKGDLEERISGLRSKWLLFYCQ